MAVVTTSIYETTGNGIDTGEDRNWILGGPDLPTVQIWTTTGDGFHSTARHLEVRNYAHIETGHGAGAVLAAKYQTWLNKPGGDVGGQTGILVAGAASLVSNDYGARIISYRSEGEAIRIDVPGEVSATQVVNEGLITGAGTAIRSVSGVLYLKNMATGVIDGDVALSGRANDVILNGGAIEGATSLGRGRDLYVGDGGTSGEVRGGRGADKLVGGAGDDVLLGGRGDDVLRGGKGDDVLVGGRGRDVLKGGAGNDVFVFKDAGAIDTIRDFDPAQDAIRLENAHFRKLGPEGMLDAGAFHIGRAAADADDRIIYDAKRGHLTYDANGSAPGGVKIIAKLDKGLDLAHHDFEII